MATTTIPRLATIGEIAELLNVPLHRIEYVLRTRPHIQPRAMAAGARCFDDVGVAQIRQVINSIDARRTGQVEEVTDA